MTDQNQKIFIVNRDDIPICFSNSLEEARIAMWAHARHSKYVWDMTHNTHIIELDADTISVRGRNRNTFMFWDNSLVDYSISALPNVSIFNKYNDDTTDSEDCNDECDEACNANNDTPELTNLNLEERVVGNSDSLDHGASDNVVNAVETSTFLGYLLGKKNE